MTSAPTKKSPTVACCAIMKNEAPYIKEWVAHYLVLGFDKIYIYENDSSDETPEILQLLHDQGIIEYVAWPSLDRKSPQISAYSDAARRTDSDWIFFCDTDEFLTLRKHEDVHGFIRSFSDEVSCISVNWKMFGSSGNESATDGLVIERFPRCSSVNFVSNHHVKSFVRPKSITDMHIHAPVTNGASVYSDGHRLSFKPGQQGVAAEIRMEVAIVNHYFTKTREEWTIKKMRGNANRAIDSKDKFGRYPDDVFNAYNRNDEVDTFACRYLPRIKEIISTFD